MHTFGLSLPWLCGESVLFRDDCGELAEFLSLLSQRWIFIVLREYNLIPMEMVGWWLVRNGLVAESRWFVNLNKEIIVLIT